MMTYRFGRQAPKLDYRTLSFAKYVTATLPKPPAEYDVLHRVYQNLPGTKPQHLFPMDGNDALGDCTIAAVAHAITSWRGLVSKTERIMTEEAVVALYEKLTGGPDTGLYELDVLRYWRKHRTGGDKILAFAAIDPHNHDHVKQAISIFGGVYLGFHVQESCLEDFRVRKTWTPGPLTNDGHAVFAVGYDAKALTVLTWGDTQKGTWGWWDAC